MSTLAQDSDEEERRRLESIRNRLQLTFGALDTLSDDAFAVRSRAIVASDRLPDTEEGRLALSALTKLRTASGRPTPAEFAALEYMIRAMRPAPLIQQRKVLAFADEDVIRAFPQWNDKFRKTLPCVAPSIGKISAIHMEAGARRYLAQGTGFVVAPGLVMTNTHVLDALSMGQRVLERGQAAIDFWSETRSEGDDNPRQATFDILSVYKTHATQDACLLKFEDTAALAPLSFSSVPLADYAQVAAVGFPYPDPDRDPAFVALLFENHFGRKRAAPGLITGRNERTGTLYHDCSTLGGNSGSPLLLLDDCTVVGLHRGGGFLWKNMAIDASDLALWMKEAALGG